MKTKDELASEIIARGAQILLPMESGDAEIKFASRSELYAMIVLAIGDYHNQFMDMFEDRRWQ